MIWSSEASAFVVLVSRTGTIGIARENMRPCKFEAALCIGDSIPINITINTRTALI